MLKRKHLIIGSGSAGLSAAEEIRRINTEDEIKLVTLEDYPPYSPTTLPYLLSGRIDEASLPMRKNDYFDSINATFLRGKEVTCLLPKAKEVVYKDGQRETCDTLLIASGSKAMRPAIKGLDKVGFLSFHTLGDVRLLQQQLLSKKDVAIYGGGLVAIELAIALLEVGYPLKLIVRSRILRRYFDPEGAEMIKGILTSKGAQIYEGHTIEEIKGNEKRIELSLSDGTTLDTEVMIIALGVEPAISFLSGTNIKVGDGVLVDRRMKTSEDDIYAAGDVAEAPDFFTGQYGMNQIIKTAVDEGRIAGANMAGVEAEYEGWISSNIFNFFGNTAFSAGLSMTAGNGYEVLAERNDKKTQYKKLLYASDRLVGAMFLNIDLDPGVILYLIEKKVDISAHKQLLFEQPREISRWLMLETEQREATPLRG
jgi:phenylglyoxylate dehydrogenase epsilon subunit